MKHCHNTSVLFKGTKISNYNNPFLPKLLFLSQCFIAVMESLTKTLCLGKKKKSWKLQSIYSVSVIYTASLMPRSLQT